MEKEKRERIQVILEMMKDVFTELENVLAEEIAEKGKKPEKKFYSVKEASDMLGLSVGTVWLKVKNGEIPSLRVGKKYFIPAEFFTSPGVSCSRQS